MRNIIYRFIFSLWFFLLCTTVFSQSNKKIDSLFSVLKIAKEDTGKVNTLNVLSRQFRLTANYSQAKKYADDALSLAEKINLSDGSHGFKKGVANSYSTSEKFIVYRGIFPKP